jgi:opacity protein-like surface antigen
MPLPLRSHCTFLAAALLAIWSSSAQAQDLPVDLELVLAVDVSGSIDEVEAQLQRQGYVMALSHPRVIQAIQGGGYGRIAVTYVEWANSGHQRTVADWTLLSDEASAKALAGALAEAPLMTAHWTSISGAIDHASQLFDGNGFEGLRQVIDVSGDGYNNNGRPAEHAREDAVAMGITINGLPIVNRRPNPWGSAPAANLDAYYEQYVIGGPGAFIVVAEDFDDFAAAVLSKLILEIAEGAPVPRAARLSAASDGGG